VTAVAPVVIKCSGIWVGWTGLDDFDLSKDVIPEAVPGDNAPTAGLKSRQALPVHVEKKLFDEYYNGCCNETYWPLFHSMPDRAVFNKKHWLVSERERGDVKASP
jgi:trehalose 6-phosphate synthase/phosphatase